MTDTNEECLSELVYATWQNGNISEARAAIRRMSKLEFLEFVDHVRLHGMMPYTLRSLVE